MIKVLISIPYVELREKFEELVSKVEDTEIQFDVRHVIGTGSQLEQAVRDVDVAIARGITAETIRKCWPYIHLVEIELTGYDVMSAIRDCRELYHAKKVGIIYAETLRCNPKTLRDLTGVEVVVSRTKSEGEILQALQNGVERDVDAFVCGRTGRTLCEERGYNYVPLRVGRESAERAVDEAVNAARSLNQERLKTMVIKKLLNNAQDGALAVDRHGMILEMNNQARRMFGVNAASSSRRHVDALFPESGWEEVLRVGAESEVMQEIDGRLCVVNRIPVLVDARWMGVLFTIQNAEKIREAESKIRNELRSRGLVAKYRFADILGESPQIRQNIQSARKYSDADANVLIVGETGTGKELFAHSIHNASRRAKQPFVAVNCAALPENLLESELFGYVEGAFSGALKGGKLGLFEHAHRGTIFLDEIGELPTALQAKLLRVLQEGEIRRIGDNRVIPVDVRVISATNINIGQKIAQGRFRSDLYYRLNLLDLYLYPLRERLEDTPILMKAFLERYADKNHRSAVALTPNAARLLQMYRWPGNVRELHNLCEKLVVLNETGLVGEEEVLRLPGFGGAVGEVDGMESTDRGELGRLVEELGVKKGDLARQLGISRTTLWRRMNGRR